jgi:hypothetical protein
MIGVLDDYYGRSQQGLRFSELVDLAWDQPGLFQDDLAVVLQSKDQILLGHTQKTERPVLGIAFVLMQGSQTDYRLLAVSPKPEYLDYTGLDFRKPADLGTFGARIWEGSCPVGAGYLHIKAKEGKAFQLTLYPGLPRLYSRPAMEEAALIFMHVMSGRAYAKVQSPQLPLLSGLATCPRSYYAPESVFHEGWGKRKK